MELLAQVPSGTPNQTPQPPVKLPKSNLKLWGGIFGGVLVIIVGVFVYLGQGEQFKGSIGGWPKLPAGEKESGKPAAETVQEQPPLDTSDLFEEQKKVETDTQTGTLVELSENAIPPYTELLGGAAGEGDKSTTIIGKIKDEISGAGIIQDIIKTEETGATPGGTIAGSMDEAKVIDGDLVALEDKTGDKIDIDAKPPSEKQPPAGTVPQTCKKAANREACSQVTAEKCEWIQVPGLNSFLCLTKASAPPPPTTCAAANNETTCKAVKAIAQCVWKDEKCRTPTEVKNDNIKAAADKIDTQTKIINDQVAIIITKEKEAQDAATAAEEAQRKAEELKTAAEGKPTKEEAQTVATEAKTFSDAAETEKNKATAAAAAAEAALQEAEGAEKTGQQAIKSAESYKIETTISTATANFKKATDSFSLEVKTNKKVAAAFEAKDKAIEAAKKALAAANAAQAAANAKNEVAKCTINICSNLSLKECGNCNNTCEVKKDKCVALESQEKSAADKINIQTKIIEDAAATISTKATEAQLAANAAEAAQKEAEEFSAKAQAPATIKSEALTAANEAAEKSKTAADAAVTAETALQRAKTALEKAKTANETAKSLLTTLTSEDEKVTATTKLQEASNKIKAAQEEVKTIEEEFVTKANKAKVAAQIAADTAKKVAEAKVDTSGTNSAEEIAKAVAAAKAAADAQIEALNAQVASLQNKALSAPSQAHMQQLEESIRFWQEKAMGVQSASEKTALQKQIEELKEALALQQQLAAAKSAAVAANTTTGGSGATPPTTTTTTSQTATGGGATTSSAVEKSTTKQSTGASTSATDGSATTSTTASKTAKKQPKKGKLISMEDIAAAESEFFNEEDAFTDTAEEQATTEDILSNLGFATSDGSAGAAPTAGLESASAGGAGGAASAEASTAAAGTAGTSASASTTADAARSAAAKQLHGSLIQGETGPGILIYPILIAAANGLYYISRKRRK